MGHPVLGAHLGSRTHRTTWVQGVADDGPGSARFELPTCNSPRLWAIIAPSFEEKLAIGLLGIVGQRSLDVFAGQDSDFTIQDKQAFFPLSGQTEQPTRVSARIE